MDISPGISPSMINDNIRGTAANKILVDNHQQEEWWGAEKYLPPIESIYLGLGLKIEDYTRSIKLIDDNIYIDEDEERAQADLLIKDPEDEEKGEATLKAFGVKLNVEELPNKD